MGSSKVADEPSESRDSQQAGRHPAFPVHHRRVPSEEERPLPILVVILSVGGGLSTGSDLGYIFRSLGRPPGARVPPRLAKRRML